MSRVLLVAAAFAISGYGEGLKLRVNSLREEPGDVDLVDEAVAILGMEWTPTEATRGVIQLNLVPGDVGDFTMFDANGTTTVDRRCFKSAIALRDPAIIAHEIGHLLDLGHSCGIGECEIGDQNLMRGDGGRDEGLGFDLTDDQRDTIDQARRKFARCVR